jgi:hypothetical protein
MAIELPESPQSSAQLRGSVDYWSKVQERVELYIPPPPGCDKQQALAYHLATRNFFAWLCRRSMVGEHLGLALVGLVNSMHEFRVKTAENVPDLMEYLDEEGYLDFRGQPNHALAILYMAEVLQLRELYIDAFAHCVGMTDRLFLSSEYQVSVVLTHVRETSEVLNGPSTPLPRREDSYAKSVKRWIHALGLQHHCCEPSLRTTSLRHTLDFQAAQGLISTALGRLSIPSTQENLAITPRHRLGPDALRSSPKSIAQWPTTSRLSTNISLMNPSTPSVIVLRLLTVGFAPCRASSHSTDDLTSLRSSIHFHCFPKPGRRPVRGGCRGWGLVADQTSFHPIVDLFPMRR